MSQLASPTAIVGDTPRPALAHLGSMPRVNLLPSELAEGVALRRLKTACVAGAVASMVVVASLDLQAHNAVGQRRQALAQAQSVQQSVQHQVSALSYVSAVYNSVTSARALEAEALGGEVRWSNQLRDLSLSIPAGIWLTSMSVSGASSPQAAASPVGVASQSAASIATISFQGTALREAGDTVTSARDRVATWLEFLSKQKGYLGATYSTSQETAAGSQVAVTFSSTVTVSSAALSQRYTTASGG